MKTPGHNAVVIVAGGKGLRMGAEVPKQFLPLKKKPILMRTIEKFYEFDPTIKIVVVLHAHYIAYWEELCVEYKFEIPCQIIEGGDTRFQSVKNGLSLIQDHKTVGIHDAVRPFVTKKLIATCYHHAKNEKCGVIPVVDEKNSLRQIQGSTHKPLDRTGIKIVQTPQVFPAHLIKNAYETPYNPQFTDDATVAENAGVHIMLTQGEDSNIKVTTLMDMEFALFLLKKE
jgi:2-C-methyl-D-erythritol 4-phosphate cytidylyltransferase